MDEAIPPAMGQYEGEHTKAWAEKIGAYDGFIFVTPEYNHSTSGVLKNAIDYLYAEWNNKAAAFVSYGALGGARAIEHLRRSAASCRSPTCASSCRFSLFTDFENFPVRTGTPARRSGSHLVRPARVLDQAMKTVRDSTSDQQKDWLDIAAAQRLPMAGAPGERADAAANRVRILQAARRVLAERGAEGTSIDAVASEAGVGKGTVFRRFGDRSGLFQALSDQHLRSFQDAFMLGPPPLGPGAPPGERLAAFLDGLLDLYDCHRELTLALEKDRWKAPIEGYLTLSMHLEHLLAQTSPTLDAPITAQLLLNALNVNLDQLPAPRAGREPRRDQGRGSAADRGTDRAEPAKTELTS